MNSDGVTPLNLVQKWQFGVEIDGFTAANFHKSSLPDVDFDEVKFSPGGAIFDQKAAGRAHYKNVTCELGQPADGSDTDILTWIGQCLDAVNNSGGLPSDYMKDVDIVQYNRSGTEIKRWRLHSSWIKNAKMGDVEGGSSENVIRAIEICYNYFELV